MRTEVPCITWECLNGKRNFNFQDPLERPAKATSVSDAHAFRPFTFFCHEIIVTTIKSDSQLATGVFHLVLLYPLLFVAETLHVCVGIFLLHISRLGRAPKKRLIALVQEINAPV